MKFIYKVFCLVFRIFQTQTMDVQIVKEKQHHQLTIFNKGTYRNSNSELKFSNSLQFQNV